MPPLAFTAKTTDGLSTANVAPTLSFSTKDQPSGIRAYKVFIDGKVATTTTATTYSLPPQSSGKHAVIIQAYDQAGNAAESRMALEILEMPLITIAGIRITQFSFYISLIIAILAGGAVGWYLALQEKEQRKRRIVIAQRDIQTSFGMIQKDVESLLRKSADNAVTAQEVMEMKATLKKLTETLEKNKQYVMQNIEEIEA
jgi:hypothetical protein